MIKGSIKIVYDAIVNINSKNSIDSIPHSDDLINTLRSTEGISEEQVVQIINVLKKSNMILSFEITKEEKDREIKSVEGYIEADLNTVKRLKSIFQYALVEAFKKEYGIQSGVHQIIKEIFPRLQQLKGTLLGNVANKAIMLDEFDKLIEKEYSNFSESWKEHLLDKIMKDPSIKIVDQESKAPAVKDESNEKVNSTQRAIDTEKYNDYTDASKKYSLNKVLNIYGVNFFFRVHLRKYEFEIIRDVIIKGIISSKKDLLELKNMLEKLKSNIHRDEQLESCSDKIRDLERTIKRALHFNKR